MPSRKWLLLLSLLLLSATSAHASVRPVGMAIAKNDHVYAWFADGKVTSGTSARFDSYRHAYSYSLPPGKTADDIIAISIAASNDRVYAWYRDGFVSSGTTEDLDLYRAPYKYSLPPGKTINSIVGIGIAKDDRVYAWYDDLTFSIGTTEDLDKHHAPEFYSLPPGKIATYIVEIDIAKSNDHVYVWYKDGFASSGSSKHLDSYQQSYGYVPAQVVYRWWGPGPLKLKPGAVASSNLLPVEGVPLGSARYTDSDEAEIGHSVGVKPQSRPDGDPTEETGPGQSPAYADRFFPGFNGPDPMIAVGNQNVIVSDTGSIAFYDKQGELLPAKHGLPSSMSASKFFGGFIAKTNADGSFNEDNINLYLGFSKPCDSTDYPVTNGNRFCIATFYDTRVFFDPQSRRFFIVSHSKNPLLDGEGVKKEYGKCSYYRDSDSDMVLSNEYCGLARRYVAFAVSKTEDPRDGFHQYITTENNVRDWPWMTVNGNAFVVAHKSRAVAETPITTVYSVDAIKTGALHPPYFRYYSKDVGGLPQLQPPTHHQNAGGLTFLLGGEDKRVDIFAFPQASDPWKAPKLLKASVNLSERVPIFNATYRAGKLYLIGTRQVEESGGAKRLSVYGIRLPIEQPSATSLKVSTASSKGFLNIFFGKNGPGDPAGSRISYEKPSLAVNKNGDMLFGYGRYPFSSPNSPKPEARYTLWYGSEAEQRPSQLLKEGEATNSETINSAFDYTSAVVDPSDDKTFWMALPYAAGSKYKAVIGKVSP